MLTNCIKCQTRSASFSDPFALWRHNSDRVGILRLIHSSWWRKFTSAVLRGSLREAVLSTFSQVPPKTRSPPREEESHEGCGPYRTPLSHHQATSFYMKCLKIPTEFSTARNGLRATDLHGLFSVHLFVAIRIRQRAREQLLILPWIFKHCLGLYRPVLNVKVVIRQPTLFSFLRMEIVLSK